MKATISKNLFLNATTCETLGWRFRRDEPLIGAPTLAQRFLMEQGSDVGERARKLYPDGILVSSGNLAKAVTETASLMAHGGPPILFEATFKVDEYVAKADVLMRTGKAWILIEVKSNANVGPRHIDDLAYTMMVIKRAGVAISKASLLLVSKDYRVGMKPSELFAEYDRTDEVLARMKQFEGYWDIVREHTAAASMPKRRPILRFLPSTRFMNATVWAM